MGRRPPEGNSFTENSLEGLSLTDSEGPFLTEDIFNFFF